MKSGIADYRFGRSPAVTRSRETKPKCELLQMLVNMHVFFKIKCRTHYSWDFFYYVVPADKFRVFNSLNLILVIVVFYQLYM